MTQRAPGTGTTDPARAPTTGSTTAAHAADPGVTTAYAHLHDDVTRVLRDWAAPDEDQERLRTGYLAHLAGHPDGVARTGPPAHLTASCLVLDPTGARVLLTLHGRAHEWFQFGGHLEPGDATLWGSARREAREESGIHSLQPLPHPVQLDRHVLVGSFGRCREHLDVRYAAVVPDGVRTHVSEESHDVRWWPADELPEGTRAELTPLVALARHALRTERP